MQPNIPTNFLLEITPGPKVERKKLDTTATQCELSVGGGGVLLHKQMIWVTLSMTSGE